MGQVIALSFWVNAETLPVTNKVLLVAREDHSAPEWAPSATLDTHNWWFPMYSERVNYGR